MWQQRARSHSFCPSPVLSLFYSSCCKAMAQDVSGNFSDPSFASGLLLSGHWESTRFWRGQRFWRLLIPSTRSGFLQSTVGAGTLFWERLCFVSLAVKPCTWTWVILGERPSVFPGISWHYRPCCAIILARPR